MKNKKLVVSNETEKTLVNLSEKLAILNAEEQRSAIQKDSQYSSAINDCIKKYDEFYLYHSLGLKEAFVERPSLIKDVDFDLWVSCENKTNRQLINEGMAPYAYDAEDGRIEIHHIGQRYDAPFAELTTREHTMYGNSRVLHELQNDSWRQDKNKMLRFIADRRKHWELRLAGKYSCLQTEPFKEITPAVFAEKEQVGIDVKRVLEVLFSECTVDDLKYISNLAESYALIKTIGAKTISEYVNRTYTNEEITCSFCGSNEYISHGSYTTSAESIQRFKCKKCERTFTQVNNSIMSGSNLSFLDWMKFIDCIYNGYSVAKTAALCNISQKSAQENKYKLFYALKLLDDQVRLKGNVVIDETYVQVSLKGNNACEISLLNRGAHKRGGECRTPGTSIEKVCVVCALDENGNSVARVAGVKGGSAVKMDLALNDAIDAANIDVIYADKSAAINSYANKKGIPIKRSKLFRKGTKVAKATGKDAFVVNRYLQRMNSYHSRLKRFLNKASNFTGFSSAYLSGYLYLFAWKERNKNRDISEVYQELLDVMTQRNLHMPIKEIISGNVLPKPNVIEHELKKGYFRDRKKADKIYALRAKGHTLTEIAKEMGESFQAVAKTIKKYERLDLAYMTDKEIEAERKLALPKAIRIPSNKLETFMAIYEAKTNWVGDLESYYKEMMSKYNISKQTVKNIISNMRRVIALREDIFVYEDISFNSLKDVYNSVYNDYTDMRSQDDALISDCIKALASKYKFSEHNITRIIQIMQNNGEQYFASNKRRLSKTETLNRDKAVFIDLLRWNGTFENFVTWAGEKYGLSQSYIRIIIKHAFWADPSRREMV